MKPVKKKHPKKAPGKAVCGRCEKEFEPRWLDGLNKWSHCCEVCAFRNLTDALGLPTSPDMLDKFTVRPTFSKRGYEKALREAEKEDFEE